MDDIQSLMVRACGSVYMTVVLNWRTGETYFMVERAGKGVRCQTLLEAKNRFEVMTGAKRHKPCEYCADEKAKLEGEAE